MSKYQQIDDTACLAEWQKLNKEFEAAAEKGNKKAITELKAKVSNNALLTVRQAESLSARCNNYLDGTYGKTKTAENFGHEKPTK